MPRLPARIGAEVGDAGRSVLRLLRFDPLWAEQLDLSADGFLRSFWAPLLALPLNLLVIDAWARAQGSAVQHPSLFGAAVSHLFDAFAFPIVLAVLARPTGITTGYGALVILANWAGLFLNVALAVAALPLLLLGGGSAAAFSFVALLLSGGYIFALWRAGRETVGRPPTGGSGAVGPVGPVLMVVVLAVGVGSVADRVGAWLS